MSQHNSARPSRRRLMQTGAAALALGAPAFVRKANAQSQFDWKRFAGQKIDVVLAKSPRADIYQRYEKEFTELTGIEVSSEQIPEQQQRQKVMIEFTSGSPSFDVVNLALHVQKRTAAKGKWMEDLRSYLADASITTPDYDFADFGKAGLDYSTQSDGRLDTIPIFVDYWMIYYNKELFAQKGIEYPKSLDELKTAAKALTDPSKGIYGFVSRGLKNANIPVWTSWLLGQGLETIDSSGNLLTDTPEAIWAAEYYRDLNKNYAPPGTIGFNWNECQTSFMQGRAAMWLDGIGFTAPVEDPKVSRVVGKVGYGVTPPGPKAHHSATFADGLGISAASKKKQAAWFYIQWATNKTNQLRFLKEGGGAPARNSVYADRETVTASKFGPQWFDCILESAKIGRPGLPVIIPVQEFRDVFGVALTNTLTGADPAAELKKATEAFKPILAASEKA